MQDKIKPLLDKVVIEPIKEETGYGHIMIPETAKEKPVKGKVIAIGSGKKDEPMEIKAGDVVVYLKNAGHPLAGTNYLIMRQSDILAVLC